VQLVLSLFFLKEETKVRCACLNKLKERSASKSSAPSTLFASHVRVTFVVFCLQNKAQKKKKLKLPNCENRTAAPVFFKRNEIGETYGDDVMQYSSSSSPLLPFQPRHHRSLLCLPLTDGTNERFETPETAIIILKTTSRLVSFLILFSGEKRK